MSAERPEPEPGPAETAGCPPHCAYHNDSTQKPSRAEEGHSRFNGTCSTEKVATRGPVPRHGQPLAATGRLGSSH